MQSRRIPSTGRVRTAILGVSSVALLGALTTTTAAGGTAPELASSRPAAASSPMEQFSLPNDIKLVQTRKSLLGQHKWYRQVADGHFVVGGWYGTHYNKFTRRFTVWDGRRHLGKVSGAPTISSGRACVLAAQHTNTSIADVNETGLWVLPPTRLNATARLVYAVSSADGRGARTTYVDAANGSVLRTTVESRKARDRGRVSVTGIGRVFDPNPVMKLQDEQLRDHGDAADAVPPTGYSRRPLPRLNGSHELAGRFARIVNADRAHSTTNTYLFNRANPYFEQTNAYYSVDAEQEFLQTLGFTDVNSEAQHLRTNAFADDNSYYDDSTDLIALGRGGVDDAEDPEVIWHEYGHAMQADQVIDFGWNNQGRAIGEGFGDYMAVTMSQATMPGGSSGVPTACVMDWDATSYTSGPTHCLRRTDEDKTYPGDLNPDPHLGGEIWSRALWDMNQSMGRDDATRVIVEAHFWMYPTVRMPQGAKIMVRVTSQLVQNGLVAPGSVTKVRTALLARHLLPG